jgi:CDP-diacylglycerol--glycerol-3-phosphate 3-phosphatidyltransferase
MLIPSGRIGPLVVLLLLVRDILVGGIRSVAAADNLVIDAKSTGKWKTGVQMAAIPMLLFHTPLLGLPLYEIGYGLLWVSAILSVLSGMQYANLYARSRKSAS